MFFNIFQSKHSEVHPSDHFGPSFPAAGQAKIMCEAMRVTIKIMQRKQATLKQQLEAGTWKSPPFGKETHLPNLQI